MKTRYIIMRNSKTINNRWFWEFYKENGGMLDDWNQFSMLFFQSFNVDEVLQSLDKRFELTTLFGKDGVFVKVVE